MSAAGKKPTVRAGGAIVRLRRPENKFGIVPDSIFLDLALRLESRLLLGWLAGRPSEWQPRVGQLCSALGLTDYTWRKVSAELRAAGVLNQERRSLGRGQLEWSLIIDLSRYY